MKSVSGISWEEKIINERIINKVRHDHGFSKLLSKFIIEKKFTETEINTIKDIIVYRNPFLKNKDFKKTINVISESIKKKEKILILGDYDVDGCISTFLFKDFFKLLYKDVDFHIPNRIKDGYGASLNLIKRIIKKKPNLIIMVDCGSNSVEVINYLMKNKVKTIVIDHHEIYKPYPKAESLINPKKDSNYKEYDYLCTSALVYFLIDSYIKINNLNLNFESKLIYVLLATVCDVMPIRKSNRILALKVLKDFKINDNFLIKEIFKKKKLNKKLELSDLGFVIGPILNSPGRLNDANIIIDLLMSDSIDFKKNIIDKLISINEKRKKLENNSLKEMNFAKIIKKKDNVLVEHEKSLNEGLIGIIASRLKDYSNKPTVILTQSGTNYKASARSTKNFNIGKHIKICIDKGIILNGGGHNLAAGFIIEKDKISRFKKYVNKLYEVNVNNKSMNYLSKISLSAINQKFFDDLKKGGPFGYANNNPFFFIEKIKIIKPKILKKKYISLFVKSRSSKLYPAISYNFLDSVISKELLFNKNEVSLIVQINENFWNNKKKLQLVIKDVISHGNNA